MNDSAKTGWKEFWFQPESGRTNSQVRTLLCLVVSLYFLAAVPDVPTWYSSGAPASSSNIASFFRTAELESEARWMLSPLYVWDSLFADTSLAESSVVYRLYLLFGVLLCVFCAFSAQVSHRLKDATGLQRFCLSSGPSVLLWIWFVGWANRTMLLAGIFEPVASVSLAAVAIAPANPAHHWRHTFARRLISIQTTMILLIASATMLASPLWWNGTGAYGLIAPAEDRFIALLGSPTESVIASMLQQPLVYESLTLLIALGLPVGCFLAWQCDWRKPGRIIIWCWCLAVAFLGAHVLYSLTISTLVITFGTNKLRRPTTIDSIKP